MGAAAAAGSAYGALGPPLMGSPAASPYMSRYGLASYRNNLMQGIGSAMAPISSMVPKGLIGGPSLVPDRQQALPYALVPAPSSFLLGKWHATSILYLIDVARLPVTLGGVRLPCAKFNQHFV